jgi:hypothetical protein
MCGNLQGNLKHSCHSGNITIINISINVMIIIIIITIIVMLWPQKPSQHKTLLSELAVDDQEALDFPHAMLSLCVSATGIRHLC